MQHDGRMTIDGALWLREDVARAEFGAPTIPPTVSIAEASEQSGFPRDVIYAATRSGELEAIMPNGNLRGARIFVHRLVAWMESKEGHARREEAPRAPRK